MNLFSKPILPMLAQPAPTAFDSDDHILEIKWDGTRVIAFVRDGLRLQNRRLANTTSRYPELRIDLKGSEAIFDGEIIVMHNGRPDFRLLQKRERTTREPQATFLANKHPAGYLL